MSADRETKLQRPPSSADAATEASATSISSSSSSSSSAPHSPFCSWVAGSMKGIGNGLLQSTTPIDVVKKTADKAIQGGYTSTGASTTTTWSFANNLKNAKKPFTASALQMLVPGFFSFETHHVVAHFLFSKVAQENDNNRQQQQQQQQQYTHEEKDTMSSLESWIKLRNHSFHFVAGSAGGLSYGSATAVIEQSTTKKAMRGHVLGHGAFFGGYDCFSDLFTYLLVLDDATKNTNNQDRNDATLRRSMVVGLSGGFAGSTQAWMKQVLSSASSSSSWRQITITVPIRTLLRAFPPGAAAFSGYEYTRYTIGGGGHH